MAVQTPRKPLPAGNTTSANAAAAAKANAAKKVEDESKGATFVELKKNPAMLRSLKFNLRDPESGVHLPAGDAVDVPHVGTWLRCQIEAGLVEVVSGDEDAPSEKDNRPLPGSHGAHLAAQKAKAAAAATTELENDEFVPPEKLADETDEAYSARVEELRAAHGSN